MRRILKLRKVIGQSIVTVKTDSYAAAQTAFQTIVDNRRALQEYIEESPEFLSSLDPVTVVDSAPEIVRRMSSAAETADVGPMAAVAGALADLAVEAMTALGADVAVVEDGGEISVGEDVRLDIAINSGRSPLSGRLGLRILQRDLPVGVATSSATVGHALSFGSADSATVVAENAALADAAATAVCNAVKGDDPDTSIRRGLEVARHISGVRGALIIRGDHAGTTGQLPSLIWIRGS
ncbi:UPF0280 family protein [Candidatus Bathyarchaeota archaeon]|nr:UPF0280 family protein [Candidatus Bathyarchaeota archaeon]